MKKFFKFVGSLFLDQFVGALSGSMLVLCVSTFFNNSKLGYLLAFIFSFGFYAYVTYNSGFKAGFKDLHRIQKDPSYRGHWFMGLLAGGVTIIPLVVLLIIYITTDNGVYAFYYMIANMYWTWPLSGIFKSHQILIMGLTYIPMVFIPWIGYIAGYNNFVLLDKIVLLYKRYIDQKTGVS